MEYNNGSQLRPEAQSSDCEIFVGPMDCDYEIKSKFDPQCLSCSTETDLVTCLPCGHQCLCLQCLDTCFNDSNACPYCECTADALRMPGRHVLKEVVLPISVDDKNIQCCVCLETCVPTMLFPCLHNSFCFKCVYNFEPKRCPLCREDVRSIKESIMSIRSMNSIEQDIVHSQNSDLASTMQVVVFAQSGSHDLLQLQEMGEQQSRFSPNWKLGEKRMRLTWYSSFSHISPQYLLDNKPDVIVIVQNGSSSDNLTVANHAQHSIRNLIRDFFESYRHPGISRLIINEDSLHFTGDHACNICPESHRKVGVPFEFGTSIVIQRQNSQHREIFHKTLWDLAEIGRMMANF